MADAKRSVTFKMGYTNTDFTRNFKIDDVANSAFNNIPVRAKAINDSLAAGTDGGLSDFFLADDYDASDPNNIIGKFNRIISIQSEVTTEEVIYTRGA